MKRVIAVTPRNKTYDVDTCGVVPDMCSCDAAAKCLNEAFNVIPGFQVLSAPNAERIAKAQRQAEIVQIPINFRPPARVLRASAVHRNGGTS